MRTNVPIALRSLRIGRRWRQQDVAQRTGLSRDTVSRAERGDFDGLTLRSLEKLATSLGATAVVDIRWRGAELDRLIDRAHASLQEAAAHRLSHRGWSVEAEVSFNHFGDRGSCDLVAWHAESSALLIIEVKSRLGDLQETLRSLDVKTRLAGLLAGQLELPKPRIVARALVLPDDRAGRRILAAHANLFCQFGLRGRRALMWISRPARGASGASGLIWFERPAHSDGDGVRRPERVRRKPISGHGQH